MDFKDAVKCAEQGIEVYRKQSYSYKVPILKVGATRTVYWLKKYTGNKDKVTYPKYEDIMAEDYVARIDDNVCYTMDDVINACIRLGCLISTETTIEQKEQSPSV